MAFNPFPRDARNLAKRSRQYYRQRNNVTDPTAANDINTGNNSVQSNVVNEWIFLSSTQGTQTTTIYDTAITGGQQDSLSLVTPGGGNFVGWNASGLQLFPAATDVYNRNLHYKTDSGGNKPKIYEACKTSNEITIEAWVTPSGGGTMAVDQGYGVSGAARIITFGPDSQAQLNWDSSANDTNLTNFGIGLGYGYAGTDPATYRGFLRTNNSQAGLGGLPELSAGDAVSATSQQVALTASDCGSGIMEVKMFLNGSADPTYGWRGKGSVSAGFFDAWSSSGGTGYEISIGGNSIYGEQPFSGTLNAIRLYDKALTGDEIFDNYSAGPSATAALPAPKSAIPVSSVGASMADGSAEVEVHVSGTRSTSITLGFSVIADGWTEGQQYSVVPSDHTLTLAAAKKSKPVTINFLSGNSSSVEVSVGLSSTTAGTIVSPASAVISVSAASGAPTWGFNLSTIDVPHNYSYMNRQIVVSAEDKYYGHLSAHVQLSAYASNVGSYTLSCASGAYSSAIMTGSDVEVYIPSGTTSALVNVSASIGWPDLDYFTMSAVSSTTTT
jgi:hypothetical protein